jgi:hypothetical protein
MRPHSPLPTAFLLISVTVTDRSVSLRRSGRPIMATKMSGWLVLHIPALSRDMLWPARATYWTGWVAWRSRLRLACSDGYRLAWRWPELSFLFCRPGCCRVSGYCSCLPTCWHGGHQRLARADRVDLILKGNRPCTNGLCRTKESRVRPGMPDSHPSWQPPAMGVLSAIFN